MTMISSAVVIPEQGPDQSSRSPTLKRRQSSISSDSSKRPRLDTQVTAENGAQTKDGGTMSPPSRRRSALGVGAAEEKKRGQRLFGALLGTLSQTSSKPAHRKRDEIEKRQRERLRKDTEEREEEQRRKREELEKSRRVEQKAWEKESMRLRHRNMRALSRFLQTKTEPKLYYKPWELREREEEQIKRQMSEVETEIQRELDEAAADESMHEPDGDDARSRSTRDRKAIDDHDRASEDKSPEDGKAVPGQTPENNHNLANQMSVDNPHDDSEHASEQRQPVEDRPKDDEHAGEELVEGQEDDVIY